MTEEQLKQGNKIATRINELMTYEILNSNRYQLIQIWGDANECV